MADSRNDSLVTLILAGNIVKDIYLQEAIGMSNKMHVPLERALIMLGHANDASLEHVLELQTMIDKGQITLKIALDALRLEVEQYGMHFEQALAKSREMYNEDQPKAIVASDLTSLMLAAGIITSEQAYALVSHANQTHVLEGRQLRLDRQITSHSLGAAIAAQLMIQNHQIEREKALAALRFAHRNSVSFEQALFEKGLFNQTGAVDFKLSDLFAMAGLITEMDRLECLEVRIVKKLALGEILMQKGLVTKAILDAAQYLQQAVAKGAIRPYQAAEALHNVGVEQISAQQALDKLPREPAKGVVRIGDLIVKSGLCTAEAINKIAEPEDPNNIRIGKRLMAAGLISEHCLLNALRCQSLLKFGYLSEEHTIALLKLAESENINVDEAAHRLGKYVPTSMQWSWV